MGKIVNRAELAELLGVDEATIEALERGEDASLPVSGGKLLGRRELAETFGVSESTIETWENVPGFPVLQMTAGPHFDLPAVLDWFLQPHRILEIALGARWLPGDVLH